jgi:hypothetical protein
MNVNNTLGLFHLEEYFLNLLHIYLIPFITIYLGEESLNFALLLTGVSTINSIILSNRTRSTK